MNANSLKIHRTLLLACLLAVGNSHAKPTTEYPAIMADMHVNPGRDVQQQQPLTESGPPAPTTAMLQEAKVKSRQAAANFAYQQAILAASTNDLDATYTFLREAVQLGPSELDYLQPASRVAFALGKYGDAEAYQIMVLKIANATLQTSDHRKAALLDDLAVIYIEQSRMVEAQSLLRQGLALREQSLGKMSPWVAISLTKIATLKMRLDETDEVEGLLLRSLHIIQSAEGEEHPHAAMAMHKLADFYHSQQRLALAEGLYQRAIAIWQANPEEPRENLIIGLKSLGELYVSQEKLDKASAQFTQMLPLLRQLLGEDHPAIHTARGQLAKLDDKRTVLANANQALTE